MILDRPTYLIAELTGDVEPLVYELRSRFNPERVSWPVDITIAGSSGVGTIKEGQSLNQVVSDLAPIIERLRFKQVQFLSVDQFPGSGILFLSPVRKPFDALHSAVSESGVVFNPNRWPYNPHCTLAAVIDPNELLDLAASVEVPKVTEIKCFSLYQPEEYGGTRIHKF